MTPSPGVSSPSSSPSIGSPGEGVAEAQQRVVAGRDRAVAEAVLAGDREVPGHVQVRALEAVRLERRDQALHVRAPALDRGLLGDQPVAVDAERQRRLDARARGVLEVAERDDVAVPLLEVAGRADDQVRVRRVARLAGDQRVGVDLGPDRVALAGLGVDHHDGLVVVVVGAEVVDRDDPRVVERGLRLDLGDLDDDHVAGAEAVGAQVVGVVDRHPVLVFRHRLQVQRQAPAGVSGAVGDREVVVRPRLQADGRVDEVAAVGVVGRDRVALVGLRDGVLGGHAALAQVELERGEAVALLLALAGASAEAVGGTAAEQLLTQIAEGRAGRLGGGGALLALLSALLALVGRDLAERGVAVVGAHDDLALGAAEGDGPGVEDRRLSGAGDASAALLLLALALCVRADQQRAEDGRAAEAGGDGGELELGQRLHSPHSGTPSRSKDR